MEKFAEIMVETTQRQILDSIKKESLVTIPYASRVPISGNLLAQAAKQIDEQKIIKIITEGIEEQIAKKEALKQFDSYHQSGFSKSETPNSAVLLFAIMAIKKQVPAKITIRRYDNEGKILNGDCPVCGQVSPHSDYCLDCGQKLDWSSDKE